VHFFGVFIAPKVSKWGSGPRRLPTYVCNDYSAPPIQPMRSWRSALILWTSPPGSRRRHP